MTIDEVEHLIEQQQHRRLSGGEHPCQSLGARRRCPGGGAERGNTLLAGQLARQINPGCLPSLCRIPGIADEHTDSSGGNLLQPGDAQQIRHPGEPGGGRAGVGQVVERGEGVRLAAAELGDEGKDRRRVLSLAGQPPEDHAGMLLQRAREAGAGEELRRVAVVLRSGVRDHLLQGNGELVRTERASFPHFLAQGHYPVPGVHQSLSPIDGGWEMRTRSPRIVPTALASRASRCRPSNWAIKAIRRYVGEAHQSRIRRPRHVDQLPEVGIDRHQHSALGSSAFE